MSTTVMLTGVLPFVVLVATVLAVPVSLVLLRLYRNAVQKGMSSFGAGIIPRPETAVVHRTPSSLLQMRTFNQSSSQVRPDKISPAYRMAMQRPWQTAAVYAAAGVCYALIMTVGWLAVTGDKAVVWTKMLFSRRFVTDAQDLERRIAVPDTTPDPDGRYRIKEFFCHNDTWQTTMERLAATSDAVLMDLRSFSPANQGCIFELGRLLDGVDLRRVVFLVDDTTDQRFFETTLQSLWQNLSADSPNQAVTEPRARLFSIMAQSERELVGLLGLLMSTVPATAAILIGVSGPLEGKRFSVKKHGLLIGRNPKNDLAIPEDEQMSGSHAYLRYEKGGLLIIDRNSRTGLLSTKTN